ncbi:MAG TPA: fibronectin type III domain-containing protein [Rhodothermales bacterium]|nr:fibronectin type III domain-containing protein [Rhodothermales bacterium]
MKYLATIILLSLFVVPVRAQITLTAAQIQAQIGTSQEIITLRANGPENQIQALINKSGANQTWDFTGLTFDDGTEQTVATYDSPPAGALGGNEALYNTADLVVVNDDKNSNNTGVSYQEFRNDGIYYIGATTRTDGTETRTSTSPPILFTPLPLTYNTTWTTNATTTTTQGGTTFTAQETRTNTIDAYGTLILPSGTFNVLRVKMEITATVSGFSTTQTLYSWFDEDFRGIANAAKVSTPFSDVYTADYETDADMGGGGNNNPPQSAPTGLIPGDNATDVSTSPTMSWDTMTDADSYDLQVATDETFKRGVATFSALIVDETGITGPSFDVTGLDEGTTYFWRVRGVNANGKGPWSDDPSFTTETSLSAPGLITLDAPDNGAVNQPTTLMLSWQEESTSDQYQLQVSTNEAFGSTVFDDATLTTTSQEISGLEEGTTYYWRVRGSNAAGNGPWTDARLFTTMTSDNTAVERVGVGIPEHFALEANYPNPFNPETRISYAVPTTAHVRLAVYDALGREVAVLVNEGQVAGHYETTFEGSGLPSGVYLYRITAGTFSETRRMLLLK